MLVAFTMALVASQAWPAARLFPLLPGVEPGRSPSSDALLQALPLPGAAERLDALARVLPTGPGVVVAHGTEDRLISAYFVLAMRLWPRPVHLVICEPAPYVKSFLFDVPVDATWRIDLVPGDANPLRAAESDAVDAASLCREPPGEARRLRTARTLRHTGPSGKARRDMTSPPGEARRLRTARTPRPTSPPGEARRLHTYVGVGPCPTRRLS